MQKYIDFLEEAAKYFETRNTNGEDKAYWANVYNAKNCRDIAEYISKKTEPAFDDTKWQLVPIEPSEEMTTAGTDEYWRILRVEDAHDMTAAYSAMLSAAPKHGSKS